VRGGCERRVHQEDQGGPAAGAGPHEAEQHEEQAGGEEKGGGQHHQVARVCSPPHRSPPVCRHSWQEYAVGKAFGDGYSLSTPNQKGKMRVMKEHIGVNWSSMPAQKMRYARMVTYGRMMK
jgi:hypothetical protein